MYPSLFVDLSALSAGRTLGEASRSLRVLYTSYDRQYILPRCARLSPARRLHSRILLLINGKARRVTGTRTISAAARMRIAAAQKARWAKWRKTNKKAA